MRGSPAAARFWPRDCLPTTPVTKLVDCLSVKFVCPFFPICRELTDDDVRTAIKNSGGIRGSLLIPEAPFELLVRRAIERLLAPSLQCKDFVHTELLRIASQCAPPEVKRFQILGVSRAQEGWGLRGWWWGLGGCGKLPGPDARAMVTQANLL